MELVHTETLKEYPGVSFLLYVMPEDRPIKGNILASGDDVEDKKAERLVKRQLSSGNIWAWCVVKVEARRGQFVGHEYLGSCSYKNMAQFIRTGNYYDDMKQIAYDELVKAEERANHAN